MTYISIIIPSYNEKENLERGVLSDIYDHLRKKKYSWEVIISDDGSTDNSLEIARSQIKNFKNFRILKNSHGGKPSALWQGIRASKGKYILFTDVDQSTPIKELDKLTKYLEKDYGVVIGSRGLSRENFPLYRRLGAVAFASFRKLMLLREIDDTQCGFKLFRKDIVKDAFPRLEFFKSKQRTKGWKVTSYDVELLHIISKMGHRIKEVDVEWKDEDVSKSKGGSLSRYIRESKEMLLQILRVKANDLKGEYKE